jgi:hypothetical protein
MKVRGRVHNGVIIPEDGIGLPEGAMVKVFLDDTTPSKEEMETGRIELPLVPSKQPGRLGLTSERLWEVLDEEDVSS